MDEFCPVCGAKREQDSVSCSSCGYHYLEATQKFTPVAVDAVQAPASVPAKKNKSTAAISDIIFGI